MLRGCKKSKLHKLKVKLAIFEWVLHFEGREDEGKDGEAENRKAGVGHEN